MHDCKITKQNLKFPAIYSLKFWLWLTILHQNISISFPWIKMADGPSESGFKSSIKSSKTHLFTANWFPINHGWLPPIPDIRSIGHCWYASPSLCTLTAAQCPLSAGPRQRVHVGRPLQSLPNELARCDWQLHPGIRPDPPGKNRMDGWSETGRLFIDLISRRRSPSDRWQRREEGKGCWKYIWFSPFLRQSLH